MLANCSALNHAALGLEGTYQSPGSLALRHVEVMWEARRLASPHPDVAASQPEVESELSVIQGRLSSRSKGRNPYSCLKWEIDRVASY